MKLSNLNYTANLRGPSVCPLFCVANNNHGQSKFFMFSREKKSKIERRF